MTMKMRMTMTMTMTMRIKKNKKKIVKDSNTKELIGKPKEIKSPNWLDKISLKKF